LPLLGDLKETGHQDGASFYLFLKPESKEGLGDLIDRGPSSTGKATNTGPSGNRVFIDAEAGVVIPAFDSQRLMDFGFGSTLRIGISVPTRSGNVGLAALSGIMSGAAAGGISSAYTMYSVPLGASLSYEPALTPRCRIFLEAGGGEMINILSYPNGYSPIVYTPFATGALGVNLAAGAEWRVGAYGRCTVSFFSNILPVNFSPGVFTRIFTR
jgi:hypothetical protein